MARNFRISSHRNADNRHLKLMGDFDGIAAHELLNALRKHSKRTARVFIHTNCLRHVHGFGLSVFHSNLDVLKGRSLAIVLTGAHASQLVPENPTPPGLTISIGPSVPECGKAMADLTSIQVE